MTQIPNLPLASAEAPQDLLVISQNGLTRKVPIFDLLGNLQGGLPTNVKDFGATGDGTTNDTPFIQAAIAAAGDSLLTWPAGTYRISSTLTLPTGQRWVGYSRASTTILWAGANNVDIINTTHNGQTNGIENMTIDAGTATGLTMFHLRNSQNGVYRSLWFAANGGANNVIMFLEAGEGGVVGNTAHNTFYHIVGRDGAKALVLSGNTVPDISGATDNSFFHLDLSSPSGMSGWIGIEFQHWCDTNQFYYTRLTLEGPNSTGVIFNSLDPDGIASTYNYTFSGLILDNIGPIDNATGLKINASSGIYITGLFLSPQPYTGKLVDAHPTNARSYYIATNNPDIGGVTVMQVYKQAFGDRPERGLSSFLRSPGFPATGSLTHIHILQAVKIIISYPTVLHTLNLNVVTGRSFSDWQFQMALYADNGYGQPGLIIPLTDSGPIAIAANATGVFTSNVNGGAGVPLTEGVYWAACNYDNNGATATCIGPSGGDPEVTTSGLLSEVLGPLGNGWYHPSDFSLGMVSPFPAPATAANADVPLVILGLGF